MQNASFLLMAGGKGTRLWPKSRLDHPKQFINLSGKESLLQTSFNRMKTITRLENIFVVTSQDFAEKTKKQLPSLPSSNLLLEPVLKDTAACIALSIPYLSRIHEDPILVILPVDALISDVDEFRKNIETAIQQAHKTNCVVTIGIRPNRPETGYGYISAGKFINESIYQVDKFIEKPNYDQAVAYCNHSSYYWNSGIFIVRCSFLKQLIKKYLPQHYDALSYLERSIGSRQEAQVKTEIYKKLDPISIDYGLIEKVNEIVMVPASFTWDDLGTWSALCRIQYQNSNSSNYINGTCKLIATKNCIIDAGSKVVAALGIEDLIIVSTDDVVLVCHRNQEQNIKKLHELLKQQGFGSLL